MRDHCTLQNPTTNCFSTIKGQRLAKEGQKALCLFWNENGKLTEKNLLLLFQQKAFPSKKSTNRWLWFEKV